MNFKKTAPLCPYCSSELSSYSKFCHVCNAKIPSEFFHTAVSCDELTQETVHIPVPGEFVGGICKAADLVMKGEIDAAKVRQGLANIKEQVRSIFGNVVNELATVSEEAEEYGVYLQNSIFNIEKMFVTGLSEMEAFFHTNDAGNLTFGKFLLQRAELEYIDFLKSVKTESEVSCFSDGATILESMAANFQKGILSKEAFAEEIGKLELDVNYKLTNANNLLTECFAETKTYDGIDDAKILNSTAKLKAAIEFISGVILKLYNPEETKKWIENAVRETVEELDKSR